MPTDCTPDLFGFAPVEGREVVAAFDGGRITSDAGGLLLGATDRAIRLVGRFAACFRDSRRIEHEVATLLGQRIFGIALGYEDFERPRSTAPRPDHGSARRKAGGTTSGLRASRRQVDAQPPRAKRSIALALSQNQPSTRGNPAAFR